MGIAPETDGRSRARHRMRDQMTHTEKWVPWRRKG